MEIEYQEMQNELLELKHLKRSHNHDSEAASMLKAVLRAKELQVADLERSVTSLQNAKHADFNHLPTENKHAVELAQAEAEELRSALKSKNEKISNLLAQISDLRENTARSPASPQGKDDLSVHLKKMLASRNIELQQLYQQVVQLTEKNGGKDDQISANQIKELQLSKKLETQVEYINELQLLNDKMYSENKQLQQKLRSFEASPSEAQETVAQMREEIEENSHKFEMEKEELLKQLDLAEDRVEQLNRQWGEKVVKQKSQKEEIEKKLLSSKDELKQYSKVKKNVLDLALSIRAEALSLSKVQEARQNGERPDVSMLIGDALRTWQDEKGKTFDDLAALLEEAHSLFAAFRGYIADFYAQSVGDECAVQ